MGFFHGERGLGTRRLPVAPLNYSAVMTRVSVRSARGLNQPVGSLEEAIAKAEFARAAAASRRRISPLRRP